MKRIFLLLPFLIAFGFYSQGQGVTTNAATNVTNNSAQLNGLAAAATNPGTDVYYRWKTSPFGSWNDILVASDISTSSTSYPYTFSGLNPSTKYYFEIAIWDGSTLTEGSTLNFTTNADPTATTGSSSNVASSSADVAGTVNAQGSSETYNCYFYYRVNGTSSWTKKSATPSTVTGASGDQSESATITGLTASTTYDYIMVLEDNQSIPNVVAQGSTSTFTTSSAVVPTVVIGSSITSITTTSAECNTNNITSNGGASVTAYGICWNTTGSPTTADSKHEVGTGDPGSSNWNGSLSSLASGTLYYVRAYATNSAGTAYSSTTLQFKSQCAAPSSSSATSVLSTSFSANWSAATGAQKYYLDVSTASDFSTFVGSYNNLDVGNVTTYSVTGLSASTTYYYRVRAYNDGGTDGAASSSANSGTISVTTVVAAPTTQASDLKWETINGDMVLRWTRGNGGGCIVIMKAGAAVTDPTNGVDYFASSTFGSGSNVGNATYCVYKGTGTSVTVTGLSSGTGYYFKVIEYNDGGAKGNQISYNTTGTDGWTGSQGSSGLPITLTSITALQNDDAVEINWSTASEINNEYFMVQRSIDGINFEDIGKVNGAGNSNVNINYNYEDKNAPNVEILYYRLQQVDYDGTSTLSKTVFVETSAKTNISITKLVNKDNSLDVYVNINSGEAQLLLYSSTGQLLQKVLLSQSGGQIVNLSMNGLSHGIYFIKIRQGNQSLSKKVMY